MKNQNIFLVILSFTFITSCCHKKNLSKQQTTNNSSNSTIVNDNNKNEFLKFEAHYLHTTDALYEEVKIKDGKISYTLSKKVKENNDKVTDQNNNNLNTKKADLTEQEVDSLISKIDKYNFWKLDTLIGKPSATEQYYTFELYFKNIYNQKNVIFKSVPGGITMPASFMKSRDELMRLARKKTGMF